MFKCHQNSLSKKVADHFLDFCIELHPVGVTSFYVNKIDKIESF